MEESLRKEGTGQDIILLTEGRVKDRVRENTRDTKRKEKKNPGS